MTGTQKVRGIFDMMEAVARGEEWEIEDPLPDFVPGMGFGATAEATRLAYKGWLFERYAASSAPPKRRRGQPAKPKEFTNDAQRAYVLYCVTHLIRMHFGLRPTAAIEAPLAQLIDLAEKL